QVTVGEALNHINIKRKLFRRNKYAATRINYQSITYTINHNDIPFGIYGKVGYLHILLRSLPYPMQHIYAIAFLIKYHNLFLTSVQYIDLFPEQHFISTSK